MDIVATNETEVFDRSIGRGVRFLVINKSNLVTTGFEQIGFQRVSLPSPSLIPVAMANLIGRDTVWEKEFPGFELELNTFVKLGQELLQEHGLRTFAEYPSYAELVPIENSPLYKRSLVALAVSTGTTVGVTAIKVGAVTGLAVVLVTPVSIVLCAAATIGTIYMFNEFFKSFSDKRDD